jgi:hypothetical protein
MKSQEISLLKNTHHGEDIYVLGSGPSMNYFNTAFFNNKIIVGVNRICRYVKCDYTILKDAEGLEEINDSSQHGKIVASEYLHANKHAKILNDKNKIDFFFWHECNNTNPKAPNHSPDLSVITKDSDKIVVSYSTITSAMHLAAYMGAKNIFLCGHDCCEIQGKAWVDGYYDNIKPVHEDSVQVKFAIENNFDCNVFELTPTLFRESVTYE